LPYIILYIYNKKNNPPLFSLTFALRKRILPTATAVAVRAEPGELALERHAFPVVLALGGRLMGDRVQLLGRHFDRVRRASVLVTDGRQTGIFYKILFFVFHFIFI
jgi:hypothetical protein